MKFKSALGFDDDGSAVFKFEQHDSGSACIGDQVWSDGENVHIYDYAESDVIQELIDMVDNRTAFKGALRRCSLI